MGLNRAGININKFYSSEIEKNALAVQKHHYQDQIDNGTFIQIGDVCKVSGHDFEEDIHLIIFTFPCLDLASIKRGRAGLFGKESGLFFEATRIIKELQEKQSTPIKFLAENVASMRNIDRDLIIGHLKDLFPETYMVSIDSQLVSSCHRRRYYFTNIKGVQQPEQKGIKLSDIIENGYVDREKGFVVLTSSVTAYSGIFRHYKMSLSTIIFKDRWFAELPTSEKLLRYPALLEASGYDGKPNKSNSELDFPNGVYRLPTTKEYCRMLTLNDNLNDNYLDVPGISKVSKTKLCGLTVTTDVVKHIFEYLPSEFKINQI